MTSELSSQLPSAIGAVRDHGAALRASLGLRSLSQKGRQRLMGRWSAGSHDFARRAILHRAQHAALLDPLLPQGADALAAQREQVLLLEWATSELSALAKEAADSLLCERARLHDQSTEVRRALQWIAHRPHQDPALRAVLEASLKNLDQPRAGRNANIAKAARLRSGTAQYLPIEETARTAPRDPEKIPMNSAGALSARSAEITLSIRRLAVGAGDDPGTDPDHSLQWRRHEQKPSCGGPGVLAAP